MCPLIRTGAVRTGARIGMVALLAAVSVTGCSPSYSPNSYASNAAQLASKVDQGIVVGVRAVLISADATLGTGTGGAAGGIAGSQLGGGATGALGALGGSVAGGIVGNVVTHVAGDTDGFEYIVRKTNGDKANGDLMSVTQKDVMPLGIGAHVLIIEGPQARIVADYTVPVVVQPLHPDTPKADAPKAADAAPSASTTPPPSPVASPSAATPAQSEPASAPVATPLPPPAAEPPKPAASADSATPPAVKADDMSTAKSGGS
ncbi:MAG: Outer rane lipoprotein [Rhodospirillales bacterium]|nr:Outer rane lipoprotein [Rhodospirillales bacterium]